MNELLWTLVHDNAWSYHVEIDTGGGLSTNTDFFNGSTVWKHRWESIRLGDVEDLEWSYCTYNLHHV